MPRTVYRDPDQQNQEDLTTEESTQPRSPNPIAQNSSISLSIPSSLNIRLVDARVLGDYETWSAMTSTIVAALIGFLTAWIGAPAAMRPTFGWISVVLVVLALLTGRMAKQKRDAIFQNTHDLRFGIGEQVSVDQADDPND